MTTSAGGKEAFYFTIEETLAAFLEVENSKNIDDSLEDFPHDIRIKLVEAMGRLAEDEIEAAKPLILPPGFQPVESHEKLALRLKAVLEMQGDNLPKEHKSLLTNSLSLVAKATYLVAYGMRNGIVDPGGDKTLSSIYTRPSDSDSSAIFPEQVPTLQSNKPVLPIGTSKSTIAPAKLLEMSEDQVRELFASGWIPEPDFVNTCVNIYDPRTAAARYQAIENGFRPDLTMINDWVKLGSSHGFYAAEQAILAGSISKDTATQNVILPIILKSWVKNNPSGGLVLLPITALIEQGVLIDEQTKLDWAQNETETSKAALEVANAVANPEIAEITLDQTPVSGATPPKPFDLTD